MPAIVRVVKVVDTRSYVEDGDRFVPVPGSGQVRDCDRCGRPHEVHAYVELDDGKTIVVGTGCYLADDSTTIRRAITGAARAMRAVASHTAELSALRSRLDAWRTAKAEIGALPLPAVTGPVAESMGDRYEMGGAGVYCPEFAGRVFTAERRSALVDSWLRMQFVARGLDPTDGWRLTSEIDRVSKWLARSSS